MNTSSYKVSNSCVGGTFTPPWVLLFQAVSLQAQ